MNPFLRKAPNKKRDHKLRTLTRVRLDSEGMEALRREVFERSGGMCEEPREGLPDLCGAPITWETMELSHLRHGPEKSDEISEVIASCRQCHRDRHNAGGRPCPRKPGRPMSRKEAQEIWEGKVCAFSDAGNPHSKPSGQMFCVDHTLQLSPQIQKDLRDCQGRDYLEAVSEAELELLGGKP